MKKRNKYFFIPYLLIGVITLALFWNFFFKGLILYPGNYMLAWYEPWRTENMTNGVITLAHKAVADDTFRQFLPFRLLAADILRQLELPLWNPYNGSGMPLLATMHVGLLNPFSLLFLIFSPPVAWSIHIIAQFILLSFFTYLYCRSVGMQKISSLFTVTVLVLSGFVTVRLVFGDYIYTLAGLPFLLYLIESLREDHKTKKIFLFAPGFLFIFLSGAPQIIFYILIAIVAYAILRLKKRELILFLLQFIIGIGLAGIQLLPTLELYKNAAINTDSSIFIFERFLLPIQHLVTLIIPNYFGNQGTYNYWGAGDYIETVATVGSIACFFAFFYLISKDEKKSSLKLFYFNVIVVTIISTLDWLGSRLLFSLSLPIISTGIPSRIFILTTFSISILAGLGFEKLITEKNSWSLFFKKSLPFLSLMAIILISTLFLFKTGAPCPTNSANIACQTVALRNSLIEAALFFVLIAVILFSLVKYKTFNRATQIITLMAVIILGVYNAHKFLPYSPKETFLPQNELITYLQQNTHDARVFGFDEANIKTDLATLFRFYDPNYYEPLYIKRYGELIAYSKDKSVLRSDVEVEQSKDISEKLREKRNKLLNLLGVKYLIHKQSSSMISDYKNIVWQNPTWYIEKNKTTLPRAYLIKKYEVITDDKKILNRLFSKSFNIETTAIVEKSLDIKISSKDVDPNDFIKIISYKENKLSIKSKTTSDQLLILSDNYYPGWKAYVDNKQTEILRTNYTFRGIVLPKGEHLITFNYKPDSVKYGTWLSSLTALLYLLLLGKSMFNKRP